MSNEEMLEILRGKVLYESPEVIQQRLNEIADAIEQLVRERDAAVADCKLSAICASCKHRGDDEWCDRGCRWEWRGVQDEA